MIFVGSRFFCLKYSMEHGLKTTAILSRAKKPPRFHRELNNSSTHSSPVKLAYASYESAVGKSTENEDASPIIIIHGIFGSKSNWNSLSKAIHQKTSRKVIAVDARNHGDSPHAPESTYQDMMEDIIMLTKDLGIEKAVMVGHSMGGRVMMYLALNYPELVEKLIAVDISPISNSASLMAMLPIFEAMKNVTLDENISLSKARRMTEQQLSTSIESVAIRQFLLTNLVEAEAGKYKWRVNLPVLEKSFVKHITRLPPTNKKFYGPTLFIGGSNSDYINVNDHEKIKQLFPAAKIQYIQGAGHWVHAEKPKEFLEMITSFINETQ